MEFEGRVSSKFELLQPGRNRIRLNPLGHQVVDLGLPAKAELTRQGLRFNAVTGNGSTFLAPITAWPTTTETMALQNGESDGGKTYFIESVYAFLASGTSGAGGALIACVTTIPQAVATAYASTVVSGMSGRTGAAAGPAGSTKALFANAVTLTGQTPAWMVLAKSEAAAAATIGANMLFATVDGAIAVPPRYHLGLAVLSGVGTTALYGYGVTWVEVQVPIETG